MIIELYRRGRTMRSIAKEFNTNHKVVSKVLKKNGIQTREPKNLRGMRKFHSDVERNYNNMATHLRFDVTVEWLMQFSDFSKLKLLNDVITNRSGRWDVSTGVACVNLNRGFIGIEKDEKYFEIGVNRIKERIKCLGLKIEPMISTGD